MDENPNSVIDPAKDDAEGATKEPTPAELLAKINKLESELETERRMNQFWDEQNKQTRTPPPAAKTEEEEPDALDTLDLLSEIIEAKDPKEASRKLKNAIRDTINRERKRGDFISRDELNQIISGAVAMGELQQEFPDLSNPKSDLFKETQKELATLGKNRAYDNLPDGEKQRIAAERAHNKLVRAGKISTTRDDDEQERRERVRDQQGHLGSRSGRSGDQLSSAVIAQGKRYGVSEEDMKKYGKSNYGPALASLVGQEGR